MSKKLIKQFPGLLKEDLDLDNPEYSCIICACKCFFQGCKQHACKHHERMTLEEWNKSGITS